MERATKNLDFRLFLSERDGLTFILNMRQNMAAKAARIMIIIAVSLVK